MEHGPISKLLVVSDGTVESTTGAVVHFSIERFVTDVCNGDCCFICGARPGSVEFNNEHVVPQWLLRHHDLFDRRLTLTNGTTIPYSQCTVPCCLQCNEFLGATLEAPIKDVLTAGYERTAEFLENGGNWDLFVWLALLFIKTHLKDKRLRLSRDRRDPDYKIGDLYEWGTLHHIHCVARSPYSKCTLDSKIHGSLFIAPAANGPGVEPFDYCDLYDGKTVLLRVAGTCIVAVLNDSCVAMNMLDETLKKIAGPLSPLQHRELAAHLSYANSKFEPRPQFYTEFDGSADRIRMSADLPKEIKDVKFVPEEFGRIMASF